MNLERFTLIVESYGVDSQQWPDHERVEALEFSRASSHAMSLLEQAAELGATPPPQAQQLAVLAQLDPHGLRKTIFRDNPPGERYSLARALR